MTGRLNNILLVTCEGSMPLDTDAMRSSCSGALVITSNRVCRRALERFQGLARDPASLTVGCTQEAGVFAAAAAEIGRTAPISFVNIRETVGWFHDVAAAGP